MSRTARATQALMAAKVAFTTHAHDYDPGDGRVGLQVRLAPSDAVTALGAVVAAVAA